MSNARHEHPSGRPVERRHVRQLGFARTVRDEPLTPGLRKHELTSAIGFTASLARDIGRRINEDED